MKTILKFLALSFAAGFPGVAFAEMLGARLPAAVSGETVLALFAVAVVVLLTVHEYTRSARGYEPKPGRRVLRPAAEAFAQARFNAYSASVRRGPKSRPPFYPSVTL